MYWMEQLFSFLNTIEIRIKEPVFIRTLRLKFDLLNPINKNPPEAENGRGCCHVFRIKRIFKNF